MIANEIKYIFIMDFENYNIYCNLKIDFIKRKVYYFVRNRVSYDKQTACLFKYKKIGHHNFYITTN